jgi:hypothetical protein
MVNGEVALDRLHLGGQAVRDARAQVRLEHQADPGARAATAATAAFTTAIASSQVDM